MFYLLQENTNSSASGVSFVSICTTKAVLNAPLQMLWRTV